jgi:glycosyltransferase involved in cell wall biosynthesis
MSRPADTSPAPADPAIPPGAVTVVADHLVQRGGAERVTLALQAACPGSPIVTSFYDLALTYPEFGRVVIEPSRWNRLRALRHSHRAAFPVYPFRFGLRRITSPVVICSSTGWAHGVRATGTKIVYWHAPARWLYQTDAYAGATGLAARAVGLVGPLLERWDRAAVASVDVHLCNSTEIAGRLRRIYGIEVEVLPPPHGMDPAAAQEPTPGIEPGFHLCVSRLLPYKNVDAVVAAFATLPGERLVIVGDGPGRKALEQERPANVELLSGLTDAQLRWLYANAGALMAASYEDFGLTPLEAASFGKPTIALRWGGFLDTVDPDRTGLFFEEPTAGAIAAAVGEGARHAWDAEAIRAHAATFAPDRFRARVHEIVRDALARG